jgi:isoamylase
MRVWPGKSYPLGATWDGAGVNFALYSENATSVDLCLFESPESTQESHRIPLPEQTEQVWHGYFPDLRPGQLYAYRVNGPYDPRRGHRFNANKVVLDPYAKAIGRNLKWNDAVLGYRGMYPDPDLTFNETDSAPFAPLGLVVEPAFSWMDDRPPKTLWHNTVIYEVHVKGFTQQMDAVPKHLRGTYAGLASEPAIEHLQNLGVTAVELLPVHHHVDERFLVDKGLRNYWGYNTLAFFAPDTRFSSRRSPLLANYEFKTMVRTLHAAGIEVILDVVYNHTAEGNELGPTLSLKGIDNAAYYRLLPHDPRFYMDFTGCGNTLNMRHPRVLQLIMDSLRYWVQEMHVDGFRFDLASALARELYEVDKLGAFFDIIHQDPILSQVKLIAEPWDVGPGGYQVGNFPVGWTEWNGKYRDCVRSFWKGDGGTISELATRLTGSSDLYAANSRRPYASINFITCHDGFSLQDMVSYNHKHNELNGENNRDGSDHNMSFNCGVEGPTNDPAINALRQRQKRNFMATLFLSQGVPMLLAGDEMGHTQLGNNNVYCQDNPLSWLDWSKSDVDQQFFDFVKRLIAIRKSQPVLRRRKFFHGRSIRGSDVKDVYWMSPQGIEMTESAWNSNETKSFGLLMMGDLEETDERGRPIKGDNLLLLINSGDKMVPFKLPKKAANTTNHLELLIDTFRPEWERQVFQAEQVFQLGPLSTALFRWENIKQLAALPVPKPLAYALDEPSPLVEKKSTRFPVIGPDGGPEILYHPNALPLLTKSEGTTGKRAKTPED